MRTRPLRSIRTMLKHTRSGAAFTTSAASIACAIQRYDRAIELNPSDSNILETSSEPLLYLGRTDEAMVQGARQAMGLDRCCPDHFHWQDVLGALGKGRLRRCRFRKCGRWRPIPDGAQKMFAAALSCAGHLDEARTALATFLQDVQSHNAAWGTRKLLAPMWTAPGSLDRWIVDLRRAGMVE